MLIVDPATGAMYKLDTEFINETLVQSAITSSTKGELKVYTLNEIPMEWKSHLMVVGQQKPGHNSVMVLVPFFRI